MTAVQRYRKKPVEIEAVRWDGSAEACRPIIQWMVEGGQTATYHEHLMDGDLIAHPDPFLRIPTLEGTMIASVGDWIIRGVAGEYYPCKAEIFDATYEPAGLGGTGDH